MEGLNFPLFEARLPVKCLENMKWFKLEHFDKYENSTDEISKRNNKLICSSGQIFSLLERQHCEGFSR